MSTEDEVIGTILNTDGLETPYRIGWEHGEIFHEDQDFEGITLTIAVRSIEEGKALLDAIEDGLMVGKSVLDI